MRNFDFKTYTPRPKKLLRASLRTYETLEAKLEIYFTLVTNKYIFVASERQRPWNVFQFLLCTCLIAF